MIPTTGAICEAACLKYEGAWPSIALFLFIMWAITLWLLNRRIKHDIH